MGIRDWFAKKPGTITKVQAPSPAYPTARAAIDALVRAHPDLGESAAWLTFEADGEGRSAVVQLAEHQVNFGTRRVDLARMLRDAGLTVLAESVRPWDPEGRDLTLWAVEHASPDELIEIVDFTFTTVCGLGYAYRVEGMHQS